MKTIEEYAREIISDAKSGASWSVVVLLKQIQLDSWKQGMTDAAYLALTSDNDQRTPADIVEARINDQIILARDARTSMTETASNE